MILIFRSDTRITLRQLTDGKHFIQLIYDEYDNIKDCEYLHDRGQIKTFLDKFQNDLVDLSTTSNVTVITLPDKHLPKDIKKWLNYGRLRVMCRKSHKAWKKAFREGRSRKRKQHDQGKSR